MKEGLFIWHTLLKHHSCQKQFIYRTVTSKLLSQLQIIAFLPSSVNPRRLVRLLLLNLHKHQILNI